MGMHYIYINGFKCFEEEKFSLNKITVLTGSNGAGKSSVIQSILLHRYIEDELNNKAKQLIIPLNGYCALQLGSFNEICNTFKDEIVLDVDSRKYRILQGDKPDFIRIEDQSPNEISNNQQISYLNAERKGPKMSYKLHPGVKESCGVNGEYAASILFEASTTMRKIDKARSFSDTNYLTIEVDKWMSYICSDVSIKTEKSNDLCFIKLRSCGPFVTAPNTGFGFIYALPIVINGLIAPENSLMIVENPEAHLHPKAQSNIGFFLGKMAGLGIQIIVETHSEHVINGIRRAALCGDELCHNDVNIYFFDRNIPKQPKTLITIDHEGNLSDFPIDFFDQVRQDMLELINLSK